MHAMPKVALIGGPDVDARLELMHRLKDAFDVSALGSRPELGERFAGQGFRYHAYPMSRRISPIGDLFTLGKLISLLRDLRPDVVHSFDSKPCVWGGLAAWLAGVPVIVGTVTGLGSLYGSERLATRAARNILETMQWCTSRLSDATIFQNHDDARQLIAARVVPPAKVEVVLGSGVATDVFAPDCISAEKKEGLRRQLGILPGEIVVTMVSRVIRSKGVLEFMASAQAVRARHPQARFLLIGAADEDSLDRLPPADLELLKQTVCWPGPRTDVPAVLASSDIFVLPSACREGIPRVLLEAAAMALPLVTTDSPGCNEVVKDGVNGFLVPAGSAADLTRAIATLVEQPELRCRFGGVSRARALEHFDLAVIAEQTKNIYRKLLKRKRGATVGVRPLPARPAGEEVWAAN